MLRKIFLLALVIGTISIAVSAQGKSKKNDAESEKGIEIMGVVARWADAVRDRNMKALDQLFSEDLTITTYDGKTRVKKEELEALKPNPDVKTVSVVNEDVGIKLFGNVAVVTALTKMHFVIGGKETPVALRYTAVFAKDDGRWQMVALQTARAPLTKTSETK
jgi:uncharacterized protein (TIGR02246 family)